MVLSVLWVCFQVLTTRIGVEVKIGCGFESFHGGNTSPCLQSLLKTEQCLIFPMLLLYNNSPCLRIDNNWF